MEGIDRAKSRTLTTINLNCFTVVVFFLRESCHL